MIRQVSEDLTFKVCIKTAGKGTRVEHARSTNKALLPIGTKAALSHIIDKFPDETEIVIAVGHRSDLIKDFLSIAHPGRKFEFVSVDPYEGTGSGPGYSLLCCRPYLQCPFIFFACDTLVLEDIPIPDKNWIGVAKVANPAPYLVSEVVGNQVQDFYDKMDFNLIEQISPDPTSVLENAFIGLASVKDYDYFWQALEKPAEAIHNEKQVSDGLRALIPKNLACIPFTWFDIGTDELYEQANREITGIQSVFKPDEFTYIQNQKVIKYFASEGKAQARARRARLLWEVAPELLEVKEKFFSYRFVPGKLISEMVDDTIFSSFLEFTQEKLWKDSNLAQGDRKKFSLACRRFYLEKSWDRVTQFFDITGIKDKSDYINGTHVPSISSMFDMVDWDWLCNGKPVLMHGDPQPENIIVTEDGTFQIIDWREDFAGIEEYGDVYYDLAKIYHALIISHEIVRGEEFTISRSPDSVSYNFRLKNNLMQQKDVLEQFIKDEGYDLYKVRILSALIYLNIAPLHHDPYSYLLYYLGKHMLYGLLQEGRGYEIA